MVFNHLPFKGDIMYLIQDQTGWYFIYAFVNIDLIVKMCF